MPDGWKVPFVLAAAGSKAQCYQLRWHAKLPTVEWVLLPGLLEYKDLDRAAEKFARQLGARQPPGAATDALIASGAFRTVYEELWRAISGLATTDQRILSFNSILYSAARGGLAGAEGLIACQNWPASRKKRASKAIREYLPEVLGRGFPGPPCSAVFRDFVGERFDGTSSSLARRLRSESGMKSAKWDTGRYFTSDEVIKPVVRLLEVSKEDRVVDMACGSGGFLLESLRNMLGRAPSRKEATRILRRQLVGVDIDPCCTSIAKTLIALSSPDYGENFQVFQHNGLYSHAGDSQEQNLSELVQDHSFDVVLGNPPGNMRYSGTNREEIVRVFGELPPDYILFVRRALSLAKRDGARIGLVLPEGFVTNDDARALRKATRKQADLVAVIKLERALWRKSTRMSVVYLRTRSRGSGRRPKTAFAAVPEEKKHERSTLLGRLEHVVDHCLNERRTLA